MLDIDSVDLKHNSIKLNLKGLAKAYYHTGTSYEYLSVYIYNKKYFDVNFYNQANSNHFPEKEDSPVIYVQGNPKFLENNIIQFQTCNTCIPCEEESEKKLKNFVKAYQQMK